MTNVFGTIEAIDVWTVIRIHLVIHVVFIMNLLSVAKIIVFGMN